MNSNTHFAGVCAGFLLPHPPVIVSEVGKGREHEADPTLAACREAARGIARFNPETLVVLSPHAPLYRDYVYIYDRHELSGSFDKFGAEQPVMTFTQDDELRAALVALLQKEGFESGSLDETQANPADSGLLDHGVLVPLHFIREQCPGAKIVALASAAYAKDDQFKLGSLIREAAEKTGRRVCVVASGDMSHKVNGESPYGAVKEGAIFDREVCRALESSDIASLLSIDPVLRERAAECGYGSLVILCGVFDGIPVKTRLIGYEAPFGIGYCVASFLPSAGDLRVRIARTTVEKYVVGREITTPEDLGPLCADDSDRSLLQQLLAEKAGVFVSLKKRGALRGCIGTTQATTSCVVEEIIQNALSAATQDPRFVPVGPDELSRLDMSVDVLGKAESAASRDDLDPSVWGVIVSHGNRRGLLLPDLEGVDTVEQQLSIACRKGGIDYNGPFSIQRFTVTRYH